MSRPVLFMAGGGTGGHVFPLLAVAQAIRELSPEVESVFIGTDRGIESRIVPAAGFKLELMATLPFRGGGVKGASRGLLSVARSLPRSRELLKQYAPRAVFSVGGYAAVPIALSARTSGIPLALMEPNSTSGLANRLVGPVARRVYTAFEQTSRFFPRGAQLRTGVALRQGFSPSPYAWSGKGQPLRILVLGGSQGARSLNDIAAPALARMKVPITIVHQVGKGNLLAMRQRYAELRRPGASVIEFIDDMPAAIAEADLVISRAGASAIAEVCAIGRPSVLVPLPRSGDHQLHNARALESAGASVCLSGKDQSADGIAACLQKLAADPERLAALAEKARAWGRPDAARAVARDLLALAGLSATATPAAAAPAEPAPADAASPAATSAPIGSGGESP